MPSGVFRFLFLQVFHNIMTEKYGFPVWVTYGFLAIFTVAFGLMLGLVCNKAVLFEIHSPSVEYLGIVIHRRSVGL